jgi:hypothetical protein
VAGPAQARAKVAEAVVRPARRVLLAVVRPARLRVASGGGGGGGRFLWVYYAATGKLSKCDAGWGACAIQPAESRRAAPVRCTVGCSAVCTVGRWPGEANERARPGQARLRARVRAAIRHAQPS